MKHFKHLLMLMGILLAAVSFTACGDVEPKNPAQEETPDVPVSPDVPDTPSTPNDNPSGGGSSSSDSEYIRILLKHGTWEWYKGPHNNGGFIFSKQNQVTFIEAGNENYGSYGVPRMAAQGTFKVQNGKINCNYQNVSFDPNGGAYQFPGWQSGQTKRVVYTIVRISDDELVLDDGNRRYTLSPVY